MPDPIIPNGSPTSGVGAPIAVGIGASLLVTPDSLLAAADALRSISADLDAHGEAIAAWQRPVGTDGVMGPGNADRSWRHLAERWGAEVRFYGDEAAELADALRRAALEYQSVESEVSARCRG